MIGEVERVRLGLGEITNKPIGGNIADKPFPQTLHRLAVSKGFYSQKSLARALDSNQNSVSTWYRGKSFPSYELFGRLLIILNLTDEEQEPLVKLYVQELASHKLAIKNSESSHEMSRRMIRSSDNPMGKWFENLCEEKGFTLSQGSEKLGSSRLLLDRRTFSLEDLDFISQNAKDAFDLSEEKLAILLETIEKEKQYRREKGRRFQSGLMGIKVIEEQKKLNYRTWNGQQAAVELGRTRQRISQLRKKFGFQPLLTEVDMKKLKNYLAKEEKRREEHRSRRIV